MSHGPTKDTTHTHTESQIYDLVHDDTDAIHDDESGEISALTEKTAPIGADIVILEDSAASNAKKKMTVANLALGTTDIIWSDHTMTGTSITADPTTVASATVTLSSGNIYSMECVFYVDGISGAANQATMFFDMGTSLDPGTSISLDWQTTAGSNQALGFCLGYITINSTSDANIISWCHGNEDDLVEGTSTLQPNTIIGCSGEHTTSDWTGSQTINFRCAVETTSNMTVTPLFWTIREQAIT